MSPHPKIKRMIKLMKEKGKGKTPDKKWILYILRCKGNVFYTGITNNIERRIKMHKKGKASKFTRARLPVRLIYQEKCGTKIDALVRECAVKEFSRKRKEKLIKGSKTTKRISRNLSLSS